MECMTHDKGHNTPFFTVSNLFLKVKNFVLTAIKMYTSYMVALLSFLRPRNPDRTHGFNLLIVGSDDSKKLAREIRVLDNYMSKERPINPAIRFKLNKPESLSKMSDLSYALDLYLNGDKQAASIEVVGVDEDD